MTAGIRIHQTGGPEALMWEEVVVADPGPGEVLLRQTAVGLNYIDVYHRTGLYPVPALPCTIGMEAAGRVEAVGAGVTDLAEGDLVAYAGSLGAYAERRVIAADRLIKVPDAIGDELAAAMMLQGMTAQYLLRRTYRVQPGDTILVHAAAGGVGLIICQWAKALGATVIGTVGTDAKAELAASHGCNHPIIYSRESFPARVAEITGGRGVAVVYDSIGKDTFVGSLDCLEPMGMMVSFGNASGPLEPIDPNALSSRGSLFFTRPSLMHYTAKRADLVTAAEELFEVVGAGTVKVEIGQQYALKEVAQAHRDLEGRKTTGSTVLIP